MEAYSYDIRIPKDRVAVLIGKKGEIKNELEDISKCKIDIITEGDVTISGEDALTLYQLQSVVKAIGRGFNPDVAKLLLRQDYALEILKISDYVKDTRGHLERVRSRIIGTDGRARNTLEKISKTFVCVYGKTVSIIGTVERVYVTRKALDLLLGGSPHANVYKSLEMSCKDFEA